MSAARATVQASVTRGGAIAADQAEQRIDAPHARPRQGAVEQRGGVAPDHRARLVGLAPQRVDIAERVDAALDGIVGGDRSIGHRAVGAGAS